MPSNLVDETRITGLLPNLSVEMLRRTLPDGSAEQITLHLTATPNFDQVLGRLDPIAVWTHMIQSMAAPWMGMMGGMGMMGVNPWAALLPRRRD